MTKDIDVSEYMSEITKSFHNPIQLLRYKRSTKEALRENNEINEYLITTFSVYDEIWNSIINAKNYDVATSVNWAVKKFRIIYGRVKFGDKIYIPYLKTYLDYKNFNKIVSENFSEFIFNEISD